MRKREASRRVAPVLMLIPAVFFAAFGLIFLGLNLLKAGIMIWYNVGAGPIAHTGGLNPALDNIALTEPNVASVLTGVAFSVLSLMAAARWKQGDARPALGFTAASMALMLATGVLNHAHANLQPASAVPLVAELGDSAPADSTDNPVATAEIPPAVANDPVVKLFKQAPSNAMMVSIFLDRMTPAERARNQALLAREFETLSQYVPGTLVIIDNTLWWKATITMMQQERHKDEAIAILRRHNIRLSAFSEQFLKQREKTRGTMSGQRPPG